MNIKSELDKPIKWMGSMSLKMFILTILVGLLLGLIAVNIGEGIVFIKCLFILVGIGLTLGLAYDNNNPRSVQDEEAKQNIVFVILVVCVMELCLFFNSGSKTFVPMGSYIKETSTQVIVESDASGKPIKTENKITKNVVYIDLNTMQDMGTRTINDGDDQAKIDALTNIIGKEYYINYVPFLKYHEVFKYIRKNQMPEPQKN